MILFLDTVSSLPEFSLIDDNKIIFSKKILKNSFDKMSDSIIHSYLELEKKFSLNSNLKLLLTNTGPGSYTALRVGISFLSGLSVSKNIKLKGITCCDLISYVIPREKLNSSGIYINSSNNQNFICFFSNNKTFEIIKIENNNLFKLDKKIESIYTNGDSLNINIDLNNKVKIEKISFLEIIVKNLKNIYLLPEKAIIEPIYISNNKILN